MVYHSFELLSPRDQYIKDLQDKATYTSFTYQISLIVDIAETDNFSWIVDILDGSNFKPKISKKKLSHM